MTIYEMWIKGKLNDSIEKDLLKPSVVFYCEIYQAFKLTRAHGNKYTAAIELTAEAMNTSTFTVRRAIAFVAK